jgi:hypothetical protein
MLYRVVMQGRTLGGADVDEVKRQFVRVTGLPADAADQLFDGMPQVIKRQLQEADAQRIAATLRAIGAAATVERELPSTEDETVIPGSAAPTVMTADVSRRARLLRATRAKWPLLAGSVVLVAGAILLAPFVDDLVQRSGPTPAPSRVVPKQSPAPEAGELAPAMNASLLHGPWRCTDQRTGVSTYWSYVANGTLIFHGDVLTDAPTPRGAASSVPAEWKLDGKQLLHIFAQRAPDTYTVAELTLARLQYGDGRGLEIQCRRP